MTGKRNLLGAGLVTALAAAWAAPPAQNNPVDGFWLSDGYGLFADVRSGRLEVYEVTSISCLPAGTMQYKSGPDSAHRFVFTSPDDRDPLLVSPGPTDDALWFHNPGAASSVLFKRAARRPRVCESKTPDDPVTNFEVFWRTFAAHHGFLKHRGVDWAAAYETYRPRVSPSTTPDALFDVLSAMIEPCTTRTPASGRRT